MRRWMAILVGLALPGAAHAAGTPMTVKGEFIDTWCYYSGVMGSPDTVVGSAHHTCALWCSAGGIPVGLLTPDGTVYMVLRIGADAASNGGDTQFRHASHSVTAAGTVYQRDGINYIVISDILEDRGIVNLTHADYGVVPPFAIPEDAK